MKIRFKEKAFRAETPEVIEVCEGILDEYAADGYDLTLRQLYYQMISRDLFPESWAEACEEEREMRAELSEMAAKYGVSKGVNR